MGIFSLKEDDGLGFWPTWTVPDPNLDVAPATTRKNRRPQAARKSSAKAKSAPRSRRR